MRNIRQTNLAFHEIDLETESHGNQFFGSRDTQPYRDAFSNMQSPDFPEYIKAFR